MARAPGASLPKATAGEAQNAERFEGACQGPKRVGLTVSSRRLDTSINTSINAGFPVACALRLHRAVILFARYLFFAPVLDARVALFPLFDRLLHLAHVRLLRGGEVGQRRISVHRHV